MENYKIQIKQFNGPFDLILFFIERDELDIHDIPIAQITNDFLEYIRTLEELNIDVASEFILVAGTLMRIKARMLIPRKELDEDGNEIDPRDELVQKLLEYQQFKEIINTLDGLQEERSLKHGRGYARVELKKLATKALVDIELESITLAKLFKAFDSALQKFDSRNDRYVHQIVKYPYTVAEQQGMIRTKLSLGKRISFVDLFAGMKDRMEAIVTFLGLLELVNQQILVFTPGLGANNFWLEENPNILSEEE